MNLAQELLTNIQYKWWFNKFCKGDESLEDKECSVRPPQVDKLTTTKWETSSKLILSQAHKELLKNSVFTILQLFEAS